MNAVATVIRKAAHAVGLGELLDQADAERVEKFKRAQAEAAKIPALEVELREAGVRLLAAKAAAARGQLFEGGDARYWTLELEAAYDGIANRLATCKQHEVELIGWCPSRELQQRRRDLYEARRGSLRRIDQLRESRERREREVERLEAGIENQQHDPREARRLASQLRDEQEDLQRILDELAALATDVDGINSDLEALKAEMRALKV
ncbi:MAG: hypothetical protein U0939_21925 [Pirellulales bacterium]